jgi:hypothetical protein
MGPPNEDSGYGLGSLGSLEFPDLDSDPILGPIFLGLETSAYRQQPPQDSAQRNHYLRWAEKFIPGDQCYV